MRRPAPTAAPCGQRFRPGGAAAGTATGQTAQPRGAHTSSAAAAGPHPSSQQRRPAGHAAAYRAIQLKPTNRPLKNVGEAGKTRQKKPKKRSLGVLNEHSEAVSNEVLSTQVVFSRSVKPGNPMISEKAQDQALLHLAQALRERGYHFITPTPLTHERVNQRPENALAEDLPDVFGWSRPFQRELLPPAIFSLMEQAGVLEACGSRWRSRVRLSSLDGQLFVHSAFPTEAADAVFFGPDTYRFASAIQ